MHLQNRQPAGSKTPREQDAVSRLLGISLPAGGASTLGSRLGHLGEGYTERCKWTDARRKFGRVLESAESSYGREGAEYCLVHYFLDAVHHSGQSPDHAGTHQSRSHSSWMTPQGDARLELLLAIQENFPRHLDEAEEVASNLKRAEEKVLCIVGGSPQNQLAA